MWVPVHGELALRREIQPLIEAARGERQGLRAELRAIASLRPPLVAKILTEMLASA